MPDGWEYIHLSTIGELYSGYTPKQNELALNGEIPYFKVSDMNTVGNEIHLCHTQNYLTNSPKKIFQKNSIVFPKNGGAVFTNKKRILIENSVVDLNTGVFTPTTCIDFDYVFLIFSTIDFREHYKGTALPTINNEFMNSLLFGLPPLAEQTRIVKAFKEIEPFIVEYDKLEQQKSKLDSEIYDRLKKSILQYAIQGKLVPQDENDEPASELLKRIRIEKKAQLGKKYVYSYIYKGDDNCYYEHIDGKTEDIVLEVPFDIPNNWAWARLLDLGTFSSGKTPNMSMAEYWDNGNVQWFTSKDMKKKYLTVSQLKITGLAAKEMTLYPTGTLLWVVRSGILTKCLPLCILTQPSTINQDLKAYQLNNMQMSDYIYFALKGFERLILENYVKRITTVHSLKFDDLTANFLLSIPPLAEQQRIVNKVNEIFAKL